MLRQFCKNVIGTQRSNVYLQRCLGANFCSKPEGFDVTEFTDDEDDTGNSLQKEFSFCHVTLLGRVGVKPKLVETTKTTFVTFVIGVNPRVVATSKQSGKWHEVHVNASALKEQVLKTIEIGDRVYVRGNLSYVQDDQYVKKYRIYSDYVRLISHSQKYWEKVIEEKERAEEES